MPWPYPTINGQRGERVMSTENGATPRDDYPALHDFRDCEHIGAAWDAVTRTFTLTINGVPCVRVKRPQAMTFVGFDAPSPEGCEKSSHEEQP